jgi:hypothetical protein
VSEKRSFFAELKRLSVVVPHSAIPNVLRFTAPDYR